MKDLGELKWFLGMHIIRDRSTRRFWLLQLSYIEKVANKFISDLSRYPEIPITEEELLPLPAEEEVEETSRISYQRKTAQIQPTARAVSPRCC
ncbi:hypothetical protein Egran_04686 [Elaphomyces granulatus]|uniref:Reverse transcriptase Ty1/copia-type domain-containing protein n=1 Tax=Elaphomyces granulatus TaxID=519963 RepID=A0A232LTT4_9EURO|nr:hypothetical protein Egran_04686 [Elaphomyces granulatus]